LIELFSIDYQLSFSSKPDQTNNILEVTLHKIRMVYRRIKSSETAPILLVTIAAVFSVKRFPMNIVLSEFGICIVPAGIYDQAQ
jgi:hypothetical protein